MAFMAGNVAVLSYALWYYYYIMLSPLPRFADALYSDRNIAMVRLVDWFGQILELCAVDFLAHQFIISDGFRTGNYTATLSSLLPLSLEFKCFIIFPAKKCLIIYYPCLAVFQFMHDAPMSELWCITCMICCVSPDVGWWTKSNFLLIKLTQSQTHAKTMKKFHKELLNLW